jgi:hypothetical protein
MLYLRRSQALAADALSVQHPFLTGREMDDVGALHRKVVSSRRGRRRLSDVPNDIVAEDLISQVCWLFCCICVESSLRGQCLEPNPAYRATMVEVLKHRYFARVYVQLFLVGGDAKQSSP